MRSFFRFYGDQNERQHHQTFSRHVCSDGFSEQNCRRDDGHEGRCFLLCCRHGRNDASAKQAEATNAAIHGLDESVKPVTDSIEAQTKTVTNLGTEQSKVTKEISKALSTQNSQQKDTNTTPQHYCTKTDREKKSKHQQVAIHGVAHQCVTFFPMKNTKEMPYSKRLSAKIF